MKGMAIGEVHGHASLAIAWSDNLAAGTGLGRLTLFLSPKENSISERV